MTASSKSKEKRKNFITVEDVIRKFLEKKVNKQLPAKQKEDVFLKFDRLDDEQIVADITGKIYSNSAKAMFYVEDGKESLSKRGIDECCIAMQSKGYVIREDEITYVKCPIDESFVVFSAKVTAYQLHNDGRETKMNTVIGTKRQGMKTKYGKQDMYWFEKGSQKALRNARKKLIPEQIKAEVIHAARQKEKHFRGANTQQRPPQENRPNSSIEKRLDEKIGFTKTGDLTWREAAQNIKTMPDGSSARSYLHQLAEWKKKDPSKKEISDKAKITLDLVKNEKQEVAN